MKRILICILTLILIFTFTACKDKSNESTPIDTSSTPQTVGQNIVDVIPAGAIYYQGNSWSFAQKIIDFNLGTKLEAGQNLPEVQTGDILVYKNILYVYNAHLTSPISGFIGDDNLKGWGAAYALDIVSEDITILNSIGGNPVVSAAHFFRGQKLTSEFKTITVPPNVTDITGLFDSSLQEGPVTLSLECTPTKYANCLRFAGTPIVEDGKVSFTNDNEIYIEGKCDNNVKMEIAGEKTKGLTTYIK